MPLNSITYKSGNHTRRACQNETEHSRNPSKPLFISYLPVEKASSTQFRSASRPSRAGPLHRRLRQVQRDEFHLLRTVENLVGIQPLHQDAESAEGHACNDRQTSKNRA